MKAGSVASFITGEVPPGLDHFQGRAASGDALWRLDVKAAGSGVTGDLLAHCIDTAIWLNGSIERVNAMTETFVKERKHQLTGKVEKVGIDDACAFSGPVCQRFSGHVRIHPVRRGHKALYTFEINGEHASIAWTCTTCTAWPTSTTRTKAIARLALDPRDRPRRRPSVYGQVVGAGAEHRFEHSFIHQLADFLQGLAQGNRPAPPSRSLGDAIRLRRRPQVGSDRPVGESARVK